MSEKRGRGDNPYRNENGQFGTYSEVMDKMREVIFELVYSGKPIYQIAENCGVGQSTIYYWRKLPLFVDEWNAERKRKFNIMGDRAIKQLFELAEDSSDKRTQLQAIKYILEENGFLKDKMEVDIKDQNITVQLIDVPACRIEQ